MAALAWRGDWFLGPLVLSALPTPSLDAPTRPWGRDLLLLAVAFTALYALKLGAPDLANPDEGRYAEIPREMVASGDWVTPRLNGVNYFEKPPLLYWAVAAGLVCFGPGEASMRLMPVVFGVGGVLLTYAAGRRLFGRAAGLGAAVVLGTTALYAALARLLILDMGLSVLMSATLFCFLLGVREAPGPRRRWLFYGLYASAALATLTKGPIGFLVTGAVMALWLLLFDQWHRLRPFYLPSGGLLFLAIAVPWHLLVSARNPTWAHFYFVNQNWERFTTQEHGRFHPWYWFIPILLGGLFPWIGFLWPPGAGRAAGNRPRPTAGTSSSGRSSSSPSSASPSRSCRPTSCRSFRRSRC
jgi:4-amino-4-deoxy-L-arabinose transferase-like glycosyltransferase